MRLLKWGVFALLTTLFSCEKEEIQPSDDVSTPTVRLDQSVEKTDKSITISYNVSSDGGATITDQGICWSLTNKPTIDDQSTVSIKKVEAGTVVITDLQPETQYFIRAFAVNSAGVGYSAELAVTTNSTQDVTVSSVGKLIITNAEDNTVGGIVTSMSGTFETTFQLSDDDSVINKGICWSTDLDFDHTSNAVYDNSLTRSISATVDNFPLNEIIHVKAFVQTQYETTYGEAVIFDTNPVIVIDPNDDTINIDPIDPGDHVIVYKPNVYLYPEETTQLQVNLSFPQGGSVVESIPDYNTGWDVSVEPSGLIDGSYTYLFYESSQPNKWQKSEGWILEQSELHAFFEKNMKEYGFEGEEIVDFTDYWMPLFADKQYYVVYPQVADIINTLITLNISEQPDNLLRLFYVVHGYDTLPELNLEKPVVDKGFKREGYFVTEWGVIL
jgi:hypothetical protein